MCLVIPQKVKYRITTRPSNSYPRYISKRIENRSSNTCSWMLIAALFTVVQSGNNSQTTWMDNIYIYMCVCVYYIYTQRETYNKLFSYKKEWSADTWTRINLENIVLNERSQRSYGIWFHLYEMSRWTLKNRSLPEAWRRGKEGISSLMGMGFPSIS